MFDILVYVKAPWEKSQRISKSKVMTHKQLLFLVDFR